MANQALELTFVEPVAKLPERPKLKSVGRLTEPEPVQLSFNFEKYLDTAPESYLNCREGNHSYPRVKITDKVFDRDPHGYDIYDVDCQSCGAAYRHETWLIRERKGVVIRCELIDVETRYHPEKEYLLPKGSGKGGTRGRAVVQARATKALAGTVIKRRKRKADDQ